MTISIRSRVWLLLAVLALATAFGTSSAYAQERDRRTEPGDLGANAAQAERYGIEAPGGGVQTSSGPVIASKTLVCEATAPTVVNRGRGGAPNVGVERCRYEFTLAD